MCVLVPGPNQSHEDLLYNNDCLIYVYVYYDSVNENLLSVLDMLTSCRRRSLFPYCGEAVDMICTANSNLKVETFEDWRKGVY